LLKVIFFFISTVRYLNFLHETLTSDLAFLVLGSCLLNLEFYMTCLLVNDFSHPSGWFH